MANKNIRGITIEIGGDTTKLGKALENSEKKSRSLQLELSEIQKSLKFDPSNVELLSQKQTVLTQNIAETSAKLDTLKEAERQVIEQFQRGEVAEEQVRALQREIIKTEGVLESMKSDLTGTNTALNNLADGANQAEQETEEYADALDNASEELDDFKSKASDTFDALGKGVAVLGTATVAVAGYATNLSIEFDKAFNNLQAQTGATAEEMEGLEESVKNIYKANLGESMADVAESMAIVKQQTKLSGDELESVTSKALLMRDTFGFDVNESIRAVNSMMNQFGISADDAYNLIAQGAQNGLNQNGDLMDVVNEYSTQFADAGYSAEDMFNMLNNGAESGTWSIDKLGDAVKEYNIRMSDGTASDALNQLGLDADEVTKKFGEGGASAQEATASIIEALKGVEDEQERYKLGQEIMGTMWEDLGEDAVYALLDTQGAISSTSDALDNINDIKYDDLGSALQGLKRELETDVIDPLGEELKPVVEDVIGYVKENAPGIKETLSNIITAVGNFVKLIVDNGEFILATIAGIGAGFIAWNVVSMITSLISVISGLGGVISAINVGMTALNATMKANLIGIIITAVVALVAVFITLWNTSDEFRNFWIGLWESIKNAVAPVIESIKQWFTELWEKIQEVWALIEPYITTAIEFLKSIFSTALSEIASMFSLAWGAIKAVWDLVQPYFLILWTAIKAIFSVVGSVLSGFFSVAWELIKGIWDLVVPYFTLIWASIKNVFSVVATVLGSFFRNAWEVIKAVWSVVVSFFATIWNNIKLIFSVVKDVLSGNFRGAWESIKQIFSNFVGFFKTLWNSVKSIFSAVGSFFGSVFKAGYNGIKNAFSNTVSFFKNLWTSIKNVFSNVGSTIGNAISSTVKTAINGVLSTAVSIINGFISAINSAISVINAIPGVSISKLSSLSVPALYRGGILKKGQVGLLEGNGAEAVVPLEKETGWINRIAQKMNEIQGNNPGRDAVALGAKMDEMIETMKALKSTIVLDTGVLVGETINQIDEQLGNNYSLRERRV